MTATIETPDILYPLSRFYELERLPLPSFARIAGGAMPEPYRQLLVHESDMTPTLEAFYGDTMALTVLHSGLKDQAYSREVILSAARSGRPAEYGSINIFLANFDPVSGADILAGRLPLGTILHKNAVKHDSAPRAFFEIDADPQMQKHFKLARPQKLYGRRNRLTTPDGRTLADIVEILAPADDKTS